MKLRIFFLILFVFQIQFYLTFRKGKKKLSQIFNFQNNNKLFPVRAAIIKENNPAVPPRMKDYKLEITVDKINFIPTSLNQLGIGFKYSTIIFIEGEIIHTLRKLFEIKNRIYSAVRDNLKYPIQLIQYDDELENDNTYVILIKKLLNESMFEYKFLLFQFPDLSKGKIQEIFRQIYDNYADVISNKNKQISKDDNKTFLNSNIQTFHPEEPSRLFYWTDYNSYKDHKNINNYFYVTLTNEGIVLSSKDSLDMINNVEFTFRHDQIVDCEGISDPDKFDYITKELRDHNFDSEIHNINCCVAYNSIWNQIFSSKEFFCSSYPSYNQCKSEITIFSQTIFSKCIFSGIASFLHDIDKNNCNIEEVIGNYSTVNKIKYFSLLKKIKKYKFFPMEKHETDNRNLPIDCTTEFKQNFNGMEEKLSLLKENLDDYLKAFENIMKDVDTNNILNNVLRQNDVDKIELKEKILEILKSQNIVVSKCVCSFVNKLVYTDEMIPYLIETINRNIVFPEEIINEYCEEFEKNANNESSIGLISNLQAEEDLEINKSMKIRIKNTLSLVLNENRIKTENENNKRNLIVRAKSVKEEIPINPEVEKQRLESLKNIEQGYNNKNPLKFLYDSYLNKKSIEQTNSFIGETKLCKNKNIKSKYNINRDIISNFGSSANSNNLANSNDDRSVKNIRDISQQKNYRSNQNKINSPRSDIKIDNYSNLNSNNNKSNTNSNLSYVQHPNSHIPNERADMTKNMRGIAVISDVLPKKRNILNSGNSIYINKKQNSINEDENIFNLKKRILLGNIQNTSYIIGENV